VLERSASCVTGECHSDVSDYAVSHWSEIDAECRECHAQEEDQHEFTLDEAPELCVQCHEELVEGVETAANVHDPAEDCLDCHDPHGSEVEGMLSAEQNELCIDCHDRDDILEEEYEHGPVAKGACSKCHDPHSSPHEKLLRATGSDLCADCHDEVIAEIEAAESIHTPAEEGDCTDCHHPHSGPQPKLLFAEKRELCRECHDDVVATAEEARVDHGCVLADDECIQCHSPHAGSGDVNLRMPQVDLCLDCHDKRVESGGSTLLNMQSWLAENPEWHEPVREGGCSECHDPHGGENFRLLKETFPAKFYAPFEIDTYGLCFSCHERAMVTREVSRKVTEFRDGDRNLHFVHVNRKKGRTCRACHDMHGSSGPFLVREIVPFGKWSMPIKFERQETGGSCEPGCHRDQKYDRNKELEAR
jgi:predicted CXXCH cytochrome family protein